MWNITHKKEVDKIKKEKGDKEDYEQQRKNTTLGSDKKTWAKSQNNQNQ